MSTNIPSQIYDFRLYGFKEESTDKKASDTEDSKDPKSQLKQFVGNGSEITLPDIENITSEADLAGGKLDMPGMRVESMELEVPFILMDDEAASLISLNKTTHLIIYGAAQRSKAETHDFENTGLRLEVKGYAKKIALGTLKRSDKMDSKVTLTLTYLKFDNVENDTSTKDKNGLKTTTIAEIDVLNSVYEMNGVNVREGIDKFL